MRTSRNMDSFSKVKVILRGQELAKIFGWQTTPAFRSLENRRGQRASSCQEKGAVHWEWKIPPLVYWRGVTPGGMLRCSAAHLSWTKKKTRLALTEALSERRKITSPQKGTEIFYSNGSGFVLTCSPQSNADTAFGRTRTVHSRTCVQNECMFWPSEFKKPSCLLVNRAKNDKYLKKEIEWRGVLTARVEAAIHAAQTSWCESYDVLKSRQWYSLL